jgi:signal transduction histidine kinase/AraC-like DNA-binding protein
MQLISTKEILSRIDRYLEDPGLEPEELLRKRWCWIWVIISCVFVVFSTIIFIAIGFWQFWWHLPAFLGGYAVALFLFPRVRRFDLVYNILLSYFVIIIFFAMLKCGGLHTSMGFVFIGINCAIGSILAGNIRWTIAIFILYSSTVVVTGFLEPFLETPSIITARSNTIVFVAQNLWINATMVFLVILFMKDKSRYEKREAENLKKIDEAKTRLYTNVSHEFRTPLTIISGIADQMGQHNSKWLKEGPGKIKTHSLILLRLVNQMLDISKIEAGGSSLSLINGDINRYVQYLASSFMSLAEQHRLSLQVTTGSLPVKIDYDPEKIMHIISNLLSNAIKFTPPGGQIYVEVHSAKEHGRETVNIHIRDTGKGIPHDAIEHIFERFYQVPDIRDETPGTGLGLALTKELVEMMNGKICVNSRENEGSEFIVSLPVTRNAKVYADHGISLVNALYVPPVMPARNSGRLKELKPVFSSGKPILLIVEDNGDIIDYMISVLGNHYLIEIASNGEEGFDKALEIIPDIIITDIMMPLVDGYELIHLLKNDVHTDHIPVIVLTAMADIESKLKGLETGADHFLVKPFNEKELTLKLHNILKARSKMQEKLGAVPLDTHQENNRYRQELSFLERINKLLDEKHHIENFGIRDICSSVGISRPQLYRKFTALTNMSIGRYIRSYRLYRAKVMLENNTANVTEAALASGFKNLSHFSTTFREEFGCSPSEVTKPDN